MAANDIYLYTNATSVANAVVTSQTVTTAASFPDLVLGDSPTYNFYFTDGTASWPSFAGNAQYSVEWALGTTSADDSAVLAYQTTATAITGGWSLRLPLNTGAVLNQLNNARVSQEYPVVRVWQQIRVTDPSGYKTTYATIRTNLRLRTAPTDQLLPNDPLPSGYQHVLTDAGGLLAAPTNFLSVNAVAVPDDKLLSAGNLQMASAYTIESFGDSLTAYGQYQTTLLAAIGSGWYIRNDGIGGNTTTQMAARFAANVTARGNVQYAIIWGGINDVLSDASAVTIQNNLQTIYNAAAAANIAVIAITITPFKTHASWTAPRQTVADAVNLWQSTAANVDYFIDAYTPLEGSADTLAPAYDSGDHLHLSQAGFDVVAAAIDASVVTWTGTGTKDPRARFGAEVANQIYRAGTADLGTDAKWTFVDSTDATAGAIASVDMRGGLSVAKQLRVAGASTLASVAASTATFSGTVSAEGVVSINNPSQSTDKDTGALVVQGGLGVERTAFIDEDLNVGLGSDNTYTIRASGSGGTSICALGGGLIPAVQGFNSSFAATTLQINQSGGDLYLASANAVTAVRGTTDAGDKDTGCLVLEGGLGVEKKIVCGGSITTGAPTGGTSGVWKLGVKVDATTALDTAKYLQVDIGGTLYKVALVTS